MQARRSSNSTPSARCAGAVFDGDTETGSLMAGPGIPGMLHEIRPLRTIFEALESGYRAELAQLAAAGV